MRLYRTPGHLTTRATWASGLAIWEAKGVWGASKEEEVLDPFAFHTQGAQPGGVPAVAPVPRTTSACGCLSKCCCVSGGLDLPANSKRKAHLQV